MPRVVMIHGLGCDARFWAPQIEALREEGYEVDAPTLPYHGGPTEGVEPSIEGIGAWVVRDMAGRPAVLIGHSMGGMIALAIAAGVPEIVEGVVLVDAFANLTLNSQHMPGMYAAGAHDEVRRWVRERREEVFGRMGEATYEAIWPSVLRFDAAEEMGRIRAPVLGIYGGRELYFEGDEERLRRDLLLDRTSGPVEVVIIEGTGHFVNLEAPRKTNEAILRWLAARGFR